MLMLQKTLKGIVFGKLVFKYNKAFATTKIADLLIIKFVAPVPYLKDSLFFQEKPRAITIIAWISSSYLNFRLAIYHKPAPLLLFMYVIML